MSRLKATLSFIATEKAQLKQDIIQYANDKGITDKPAVVAVIDKVKSQVHKSFPLNEEAMEDRTTRIYAGEAGIGMQEKLYPEIMRETPPEDYKTVAGFVDRYETLVSKVQAVEALQKLAKDQNQGPER